MNYLAHLMLSEATPEGWIGALLGDFAKGSIEGFPAGVRQGILLHRAIDSYTDRHPTVRLSCARVSAGRRRFAGIMVDMYYDHFLARSWDAWSAIPLEKFAAGVYEVLEAERDWLPERLARILPYMRADNWLVSYREVDSIRIALDRMAKRLRRQNPLPGAADELLEHYANFERDFNAFFPELVAFVRAHSAGNRAE